jgi:hypothetical protein
MKRNPLFVGLGLLLVVPALLILLAFTQARENDEENEATFRWDIVHAKFPPPNLEGFAGGHASARANDCVPPGSSSCSKITVTGSGTFRVGHPKDVTGGGTWETFDNTGASNGSGDFEVTRLVRFDVAPGTQTSTFIDHIGDGTLTDNRAGLVSLQIAYSDGTDGILVVSCHLNGGPDFTTNPAAPATVFEGITASKDFVDYWNREAPVAGVDADRTFFHILPDGD